MSTSNGNSDFPSETWFANLAAHATEEPTIYRALGFADFRLIVETIGPSGIVRSFGLVLDGYDVLSTGELEDPTKFAADAVISGLIEVWEEMVSNIAEHGMADGQHTLNALSIANAPLIVKADDPMGRDKFFRFAQTLQTLFDASGRRIPVAT